MQRRRLSARRKKIAQCPKSTLDTIFPKKIYPRFPQDIKGALLTIFERFPSCCNFFRQKAENFHVIIREGWETFAFNKKTSSSSTKGSTGLVDCIFQKAAKGFRRWKTTFLLRTGGNLFFAQRSNNFPHFPKKIKKRKFWRNVLCGNVHPDTKIFFWHPGWNFFPGRRNFFRQCR